MERFTISIDQDLAREFDALMRAKGYRNRSEAVRDMLRNELENFRLAAGAAPECVGVLSYVYNHHERSMAQKVIEHAHAEHDLVVSTMHAHLDHDNCIETMILRGPTARTQRFAEALIAEPGVRHGKLNLIPVKSGRDAKHRHVHSRPIT